MKRFKVILTLILMTLVLLSIKTWADREKPIEERYGILGFDTADGLVLPLETDQKIDMKREIRISQFHLGPNRMEIQESYDLDKASPQGVYYYPFIHSLDEEDGLAFVEGASSRLLLGRVLPRLETPNSLNEDDIHTILRDQEYLDFLENPVGITDRQLKILDMGNLPYPDKDSDHDFTISFDSKNGGYIFGGFAGHGQDGDRVSLSVNLRRSTDKKYIIFIGQAPKDFYITYKLDGKREDVGNDIKLLYRNISLNDFLLSKFDEYYENSFDPVSKLRLLYEAIEKTHTSVFGGYELERVSVSLDEALQYMGAVKRYSYIKIEDLANPERLIIRRRLKFSRNLGILNHEIYYKGLSLIGNERLETRVNLADFEQLLYYDLKPIGSKDFRRISGGKSSSVDIPKGMDASLTLVE